MSDNIQIKKASELQKLDSFKIGKQRKYRVVQDIIPLTKENMANKNSPDIGKLLIITRGCKQILLHPDNEVKVLFENIKTDFQTGLDYPICNDLPY